MLTLIKETSVNCGCLVEITRIQSPFHTKRAVNQNTKEFLLALSPSPIHLSSSSQRDESIGREGYPIQFFFFFARQRNHADLQPFLFPIPVLLLLRFTRRSQGSLKSRRVPSDFRSRRVEYEADAGTNPGDRSAPSLEPIAGVF